MVLASLTESWTSHGQRRSSTISTRRLRSRRWSEEIRLTCGPRRFPNLTSISRSRAEARWTSLRRAGEHDWLSRYTDASIREAIRAYTFLENTVVISATWARMLRTG